MLYTNIQGLTDGWHIYTCNIKHAGTDYFSPITIHIIPILLLQQTLKVSAITEKLGPFQVWYTQLLNSIMLAVWVDGWSDGWTDRNKHFALSGPRFQVIPWWMHWEGYIRVVNIVHILPSELFYVDAWTSPRIAESVVTWNQAPLWLVGSKFVTRKWHMYSDESGLWIKIWKLYRKSGIYPHILPKYAYLSRSDQSL